MFVTTIEFPPIDPQDEATFQEWFTVSNEVYHKCDGFVSRRLLKRVKGGEVRYLTLVEHESEQTFMRMHTSPERRQAFDQLQPLLRGAGLKAQFFQVVAS